MSNAAPKDKRPTKAEQTVAHVTRQYFKDKVPLGPEQVSNELLAVRTFVTEPAHVGIDMGLTLNLGNFESARIDVRLSEPCYVEEKDDAYNASKSWVEARLMSEVRDVRKNKPDIF